MSDEHHHVGDGPVRKRVSPIAILLVVLALYPLSIGPAAGLIEWLGPTSAAGQKVNDILTPVFRPLVWIAEIWPPLMGLIQKYMSWFMP